MVNHIVLWNFNERLNQEERKEAGEKMKELLEGLKNVVEGVIELRVVVNEIGSSNRDIALISSFESREALKGYQVHPGHIEAGKYVRSVTCDRACLDYEV
ncbi:MAG: Dabb family protein [Lachnospiraceae bacterium]|nr:Dabb family protein [Lachnospiraceae bacterium]